MDKFEAKIAWLHRKGTAFVWEFVWDEDLRLLVHDARKHRYALRFCRETGFWVGRLTTWNDGKYLGCTEETKKVRAREIEFKHGGRYIFP